nr:membrane protein [Streptococcus orisratti]
MTKKTLFNASFEESLNLEDDGFLQFQKKDYYNKLGKAFKKGKPSFWFIIQSSILTLLFPIAMNFMLYVLSISLHDNPEELARPVSQYPVLTVEVYLIGLLIWLTLVLIGKFFRRTYILAYRYRFHVMTFLIWFILEFDLLAIDVSLPTLSIWGIGAIFGLLLILAYVMFTGRVRRLKTLLYGTDVSSSLSDKIASKIAVYGMGILGLGVIIRILLSTFSIKLSDSLTGLGLFLAWIILNIALIAMLIYMEFPFFIQAYYKWKYPEEYREWEGKSLEDWYGKRYLKKHPELLEREDYNHNRKEDTI